MFTFLLLYTSIPVFPHSYYLVLFIDSKYDVSGMLFELAIIYDPISFVANIRRECCLLCYFGIYLVVVQQ